MSSDPAPTGRSTVGAARLFAEAFLVALAVSATLFALGAPELATLSVALVAIALSRRMGQVLDANRDAIWTAGETPWAANRRTALAVLAIFLGIGVAFAGIALWAAPTDPRVTFGSLLADSALGDAVDTRFGAGMGAVMVQNYATLGILWLAGFVAGPPAVLLAIGWNAAIWVAAIDGLAFAGIDAGQLVSLSTLLATTAAVAPYLLLELAAYVLGAMSAVFASRALSRYRAGDQRRRRVFRAVGLLLACAAGLIVVAALLEDRLTPLLLGG